MSGGRRAATVGAVTLWYGLSTVPALCAALTSPDADRHWRDVGDRAVACLWRLGPAFVKFGQLLASRRDVMPEAFCAALDAGLARRRSTCGTETFHGSIATVTREIVGGTPVAVKVKRPGVAQRLDLDLNLLEGAAAAVERVRAVRMPLLAITREMTNAVRGQCDLEREAVVLTEFARLEQTLPVVFPRVIPQESDGDRITMTWLEGQYLTPAPADARRVARQLVQVVFEMLFVGGLVHCDLHPGNWWVLPDGRLAIVDAGFAYQLDPDMLDHFGEFFLGMAAGNGEVCARHALATTTSSLSPAAEAAFRRDIGALIEDTTGRTAGDFSLAGFAARLFAIQRRHGAYSKASFIFPFAALLAIEGQVKSLDPAINFQGLSGPIVLRGLINRSRARTGGATSQSGTKVQNVENPITCR